MIGIDLLSETLLPAIFELSQDKVGHVFMRSVVWSSQTLHRSLGVSFMIFNSKRIIVILSQR